MFKKKKKVGLEQPKLTCEGEKKKKKNQSRTRKKNPKTKAMSQVQPS